MNRKNIGIALLLVIILVVIGVIWFTTQNRPSNAYQAVFLSNNQVYFGRVSEKNGEYVTLQDIYYIQVNQPLQSQSQGTQPLSEANINLVKLGSELHGPQDKMEINREHILFIEDLKDDSQVVHAIQTYKQNQQ